MSASPPDNQRLVFGSLVFTLGALFLLVNLAGMARLAYDVVVLGTPTGLAAKLLVLAAVFLLGMALGAASHRRFQNSAFPRFAPLFAWVYLTLLSLTYLGTTFRVSLHDYSLLLFGAFVLILLAEAGSILLLRLYVSDPAIGVFAIPMLAVVLFHFGLLVYVYVFEGVPVTLYLAGDLAFLLLMATVSVSLLGENGLRSLVERLIERVG
jgi:hypothetical protein